MNIEAILREIDAEINKLERIRNIMEELLPSAPRKKLKVKRRAPVQSKEFVAEPKPAVLPPTLTVLPQRPKREYRASYRPVVREPRALASVIPQKPVFVPRAEVVACPEPVPRSTEFVAEALEAAVRKNFFGVAS